MSEPFKRWLSKHYPDDAGCFDTYRNLRREWMPWKRVTLQMVSLVIGAAIIYIPTAIYAYNERSGFGEFVGFLGIIAAICVGIAAMAFTDITYDKRSAKPTPRRKKKSK